MDNAPSHDHVQVNVGGRIVDEGMVELLKCVWGFGIRTLNCCQGGEDTLFKWAWIQFFDIPEGIRFLEGTCFLANWKYNDQVRLYLTAPVVSQVGPSPVVLMNYALLPEITRLWNEGTTAKKPNGEEKEQETESPRKESDAFSQ